MSVVLENITKYHPPSVLHLLPFSKNNAGMTSPNMVTTPANQQASYATEVNKNGFPTLGSKSDGRVKPRSKSAAVADDKNYLHNQQQQQRLFRASSERLSRSLKKPTSRIGFIERARSEYAVKSDRKLTQEVVTFAIKDINEQSLGRTYHDKNEPPDLDNAPTNNENGRYKMKPLLKPIVKLSEGRWLQTNARFWRSSTISPGERELQRHKNSLDVQLSALTRSKIVKLNVKDLPRSQTPIAENDPDKLNMKQVIAFLQSSGEVRDVGNDEINEKKKTMNSKNGTNSKNNKKKQDNSKSAETLANGVKDNAAVLMLAAKSRRKEEWCENSQTIKRNEIGKPQISNSHPNKLELDHKDNSIISKTDSNNNLDTAVRKRPNSYSGDLSDKTGDKHSQINHNGNNNRILRPKSLQYLKENTEFRIPAGIRQIRESTVDNKPFRLHRFLTLVSNTPEEENCSKNKVSDSKVPSPASHNNSSNNSRSSLTISKSKDDQTYADTKGFFLTRNGPIKNYSERKREGRKSRHSHNQTNKTGESDCNGNDNIICLPTAPVEVDSDDDNFISLPTVPSKSTRKDLVLSAHGHAILTKHFPQVETFKKATMRPHSHKITLKRRLEIDGDVRIRPSTVKPKDLVEWGGVRNPERIFLTDPGDNDSAFKSSILPNDSKPTQNNTNTAIANGDSVQTNNNLQDNNRLESPSRSERSSHPGKTFNSPTRSKNSDDVITFPSDKHSTDTSSVSSRDAVVGRNTARNGNASKSKPESVSPSLSDPVRLTLRKERNLTREKTYMVDMESTGADGFVQQRKQFSKDSGR